MAIRKFKGDGVIRRFFKAWPGEKRFGVFRFLPFFVFVGASMEFTMIHWTVGTTNFYHVYKKRVAKNTVDEELRKEGRVPL